MTDENALLAKALARAPLTRAETAALLSVKNPFLRPPTACVKHLWGTEYTCAG